MDDACINYFRYIEGARMSDFYALDLPEYRLIMKAIELREIDKSRWSHLTAWLSMKAAGKKKSGKGYRFIYNTFRKFFDYEKILDKASNREKKGRPELARLSAHMAGKE